MVEINQLELHNLKKIICYHEMNYQKLNVYASQATDYQVQQILKKLAQESLNIKQNLMSFIND